METEIYTTEFSKLFIEMKTYFIRQPDNQIIWRSTICLDKWTNVKLFQDDIESNAHFQMLVLDNAPSPYETSKRELDTTNGASID